MRDQYGSDFISIVDENGTEYELEVLITVEYGGSSYLAVIPADGDDLDLSDVQLSILKAVEEDGEEILCAIEDDAETEAVYSVIMDQLYTQDEESE